MDEMIVNFDQYIDNKDKHLSKYDNLKSLYNADPDSSISMWVADMDFNSPQSVIDAMEREVRHGVFGYYGSHHSYLEAVKGWMKKRHNWDISMDWCYSLTRYNDEWCRSKYLLELDFENPYNFLCLKSCDLYQTLC